jgi:hypothetical protein
VPLSLFEMLTPDGLKYAPYCCTDPATHDACTEPMSSRALGRCSLSVSLFPQGGCPLARYARIGQDRDTNNFGMCEPGPVRRAALSRAGGGARCHAAVCF